MAISRKLKENKSGKSSSQLFRNCYINLYTYIRNYLWDFETVQLIAELELQSFQVFPSTTTIQSLLSQLRRNMSSVLSEDEELGRALAEFEETISQNLEVVSFIEKFREVNLNDN